MIKKLLLVLMLIFGLQVNAIIPANAFIPLPKCVNSGTECVTVYSGQCVTGGRCKTADTTDGTCGFKSVPGSGSECICLPVAPSATSPLTPSTPGIEPPP